MFNVPLDGKKKAAGDRRSGGAPARRTARRRDDGVSAPRASAVVTGASPPSQKPDDDRDDDADDDDPWAFEVKETGDDSDAEGNRRRFLTRRKPATDLNRPRPRARVRSSVGPGRRDGSVFRALAPEGYAFARGRDGNVMSRRWGETSCWWDAGEVAASRAGAFGLEGDERRRRRRGWGGGWGGGDAERERERGRRGTEGDAEPEATPTRVDDAEPEDEEETGSGSGSRLEIGFERRGLDSTLDSNVRVPRTLGRRRRRPSRRRVRVARSAVVERAPGGARASNELKIFHRRGSASGTIRSRRRRSVRSARTSRKTPRPSSSRRWIAWRNASRGSPARGAARRRDAPGWRDWAVISKTGGGASRSPKQAHPRPRQSSRRFDGRRSVDDAGAREWRRREKEREVSRDEASREEASRERDWIG